MKLKDQFRFVRQNMKKNRTRVYMTILATAISVTFLIVLASVGFGLHKSIIKETMERRIVTEIEVHGKEEGSGAYRSPNDEDIAFFEKLEDVKAVTRRKTFGHSGSYEIDGFQVHAETVVAHIPSEVKAGLELSEGRMPKADDEVVVGYHFKEELRPKDATDENFYNERGELKEEFRYEGKLIGQTVTFNAIKIEDGKEVSKPFEVKIVGIRKKPTKEWVYDQTVFTSNSFLEKVEEFTAAQEGGGDTSESSVQENNQGYYDQVKVYVTNMEAVKGVSDKLTEKKYGTYSVLNEMKEINIMFAIVKTGLIFIGTVAILIASIGIYNTMTMAVTERASDIGIMKAIGANPATIKKIFLLESSYIGLIGAAIGTIIAYGISFVVNFSIPLIIKQAFGENPPEGLIFSHIPFTLTIISFVICYIVTILSGYRPAQRATKVDVLQAMRREV